MWYHMLTPAPWKKADVPDPSGGIRIFSLSSAEMAPATVYGDTPKQAEANANLVVAAHDMLRALQYASNDVHRSDEADGEFVISNEAVARIRDAIVKAEGK